MKKKGMVLFALVVLMAGVFSQYSFGDGSDPIISKSYLDKRLKDLELRIDNHKSSEPVVKPLVFTPVNVKEGEILIFEEGAEFILRAGEARVIDPSTNGIPDLTSGENLIHNQEIPLNHLFLCPRSDKRGFISDSEIWVMIKGSYTKTSNGAEELQ